MDTPDRPLLPRDFHPALVGAPYFYVSGEDVLQIESFNSAASVTLAIVGRFLTLEGVVMPFAFTHTPNTNSTSKKTLEKFGEGWLLNVDVIVTGGAPSASACFVLLTIQRGFTGAVQELALLNQGYVTTTQRLPYPPVPVASSTSVTANGTARIVVGSVPAAGAEVSEAVPAGKTWRLLALHVNLTTSAAVANRNPGFEIQDGLGNVVFSYNTGFNIAASGSCDLMGGLAINYGVDSFATHYAIPIPAFLLPAGALIKTKTGAIQAADQYTAPILNVEEL